jgi:hypothetical protein
MFRKAFIPTLILIAAIAPAAPAGGGPGQETIALPDEFRPEGIASGKSDRFFVGSIPLGAVFSGSYRTGDGSVLVPPHPGRNHVGLKASRGKLFVAGGESKALYVYDARTGADVAAFPLPDAGFVNDVVVTKRAAYFTDSLVAQVYRLGIRRDGSLGNLKRIPITGEFQYVAGFNANGIETAGKRLVIVQSNTGKLFSVNPRSGRSREIELDTPVTQGDGLLRRGRKLYVVQNRANKIAVVKLGRSLRSGDVRRFITDARLDVPTTLAPFRKSIYAVNARFDRPDDTDDDIVKLPR